LCCHTFWHWDYNFQFILVCFGVKSFLKNVFSIFRCLVGEKIMVNKNYFQFDSKSLFNFLKTVNRFLDLKSLFLHAHLWKSATAGHWSLLVAQLYHQRSPNFIILLSESGQCRNLVSRNLATSPVSNRPNSGETGQI
jgi:hypothetical protein